MSRFKHFTHSLLSGYGSLGANVIYTLASVPLALAYLSREEYGLWGVVTQIMLCLMLMDSGVSGAAARIIIEHKDDRVRLAETLKAATAILCGQGLIVLTLACLFAGFVPGLLDVPSEMAGILTTVVQVYAFIFSVGLAFKAPSLALFAFHRNDLVNYGQIVGFFLQLGILWGGFEMGLGLWSLVAAYGVAACCQIFFCVTMSCRLGLFPAGFLRGPLKGERFLEIFQYAKDRALVIVGEQVLLAAPTLLIARFLGLEQVAAWTVGTRMVLLCQQLLYRINGFAYPALAEMHVRNEMERFGLRFKELTIFTLVLGGAAAAFIIGVNDRFVGIWTAGKIEWSWHLDFVLVVWMLVSLSVRSHWIAISISKRIGFMQWVYFLEALTVVICGVAFLSTFPDLASMSVVMVGAALMLSFPYTIWRTSRLLRRPASEAGCRWFGNVFAVLAPMLLVVFALRELTHSLGDVPAFLSLAGSLAFVGFGLLALQSVIRRPLLEVFSKWKMT